MAVGLSLSGHFPASRFLEASSRKTPTLGEVFGVGFGFSGGVAVVWRRCSGDDVVLRRWSSPDFGASELRRCSDDAVVLRRCSEDAVWRGGSVRCSAAATTGSAAASAAAPRDARVRCMSALAVVLGGVALHERGTALRTPITAINNNAPRVPKRVSSPQQGAASRMSASLVSYRTLAGKNNRQTQQQTAALVL